MLKAPKDFDSVLKICYGDYMQLPPLGDRIPHSENAYYIDP